MNTLSIPRTEVIEALQAAAERCSGLTPAAADLIRIKRHLESAPHVACGDWEVDGVSCPIVGAGFKPHDCALLAYAFDREMYARLDVAVPSVVELTG